jgi:hypothetical protein
VFCLVRPRHRLCGATTRWVLAVASFGFSTMEVNGTRKFPLVSAGPACPQGRAQEVRLNVLMRARDLPGSHEESPNQSDECKPMTMLTLWGGAADSAMPTS